VVFGYQYHLAISITLLSVSPCYQYHLAISITLLSVSPCYQYHLVISIILLSVSSFYQYQISYQYQHFPNTSIFPIPAFSQYQHFTNTSIVPIPALYQYQHSYQYHLPINTILPISINAFRLIANQIPEYKIGHTDLRKKKLKKIVAQEIGTVVWAYFYDCRNF